MIILFQSECEGSALKKTRRVLDSFANRIGQRSWKSSFTMEGLDAVRKLLNKSASKNTAVACHIIKDRQRTELLWIVGSRNKFDSEGYVPVHITHQNLLRNEDENLWHYLPSVKALVAIAALFHDWGKASLLFQEKLKCNSKKGDPLRHEWVSYLLFVNLIYFLHAKDDKTWIEGLIECSFDENALIENLKNIQKYKTTDIPPIASLIGILIVTHHKLPYLEYAQAKQYRSEKGETIGKVFGLINSSWGYKNLHDEKEFNLKIDQCFEYKQGLLLKSQSWIKMVKKWATNLFGLIETIEESFKEGLTPVLFHHCRVPLMLADHYFSSIPEDPKFIHSTSLIANTYRKTGKPHQWLEEHLLGVTKNALYIAHLLPKLENDLGVSKDNRALNKISPLPFRWQDKAVSTIKKFKKEENITGIGTFIVNLASTGAGKTIANAKVMQALSEDENSLRFSLALGLRSLTKQTGEEYRNRIGLDESQLAVLIGGVSPSDLEKNDDSEDDEIEALHYDENLLDGEMDYFMDISNDQLSPIFKSQKDRKFLYAPVVVCTIDHLMGATESIRSIKNILPSLRLMSSNLVIDEIDDFSPNDLIAIGRLIFLTAMLGRNVMISSATIPPDLAEGYLNAYVSGWELFSKFKGLPNVVTAIIIDEFSTKVSLLGKNQSISKTEEFRVFYENFIEKRIIHLKSETQKRKGRIINCQHILDNSSGKENSDSIVDQYFEMIKETIIESHKQHHYLHPQKDMAISFGVVRLANIPPCISLTRYLLNTIVPSDFEIKIMPYHSQQVMLLRHEQEKHLDSVLKRNSNNSPYDNVIIKDHISHSHAKNLVFILITTPVEEIGRDHDFDWAIIEPSSYRSIIQMSGRVMRHRNVEIITPNISILQYNLKGLEQKGNTDYPCFIRPGYETSATLDSHNLNEIVDVGEIERGINSIPRIRKGDYSRKQQSLIDLEHFVMHKSLTNYETYGPSELQGNLKEHWYVTGLPAILTPFRSSEPRLELYYIYDEENNYCYFAEKDEEGKMINRESIYSIQYETFSAQERLRMWMVRDYISLLEMYSDLNQISMNAISHKYGITAIPKRENKKYNYSDELGFNIL